MNGRLDRIFSVPVSEEKNSLIGDEIFTEEDFDEKYPNSTTFWFSAPEYEDGYNLGSRIALK